MIPIQAKAAVAIAALILAFTTGWMVKGWQTDAQRLQAYQDAVDRGNAMGAKLETVLAKLEENKFVVKSEVRREIEKPIYSECVLTSGAVSLFNKSAIGNSSEP